jgi:[ribosomal protein S5]-alanine N-acetyltransferase
LGRFYFRYFTPMEQRPIFKQVVLETPRLRLKELSPEILHHYFSDHSDEEIKVLMGLSSDYDLEIERMKYEGGYTTYNMSFKSFLLELKQNGQVIGRAGFHNWYAGHFRAEIGYMLHDEYYRNRGYMTEAVTAIVNYGFRKMGLNRIEAHVGVQNIASLKILHHLGFREEGLLREHYFTENRIEDSIVLALLEAEYPGMSE